MTSCHIHCSYSPCCLSLIRCGHGLLRCFTWSPCTPATNQHISSNLRTPAFHTASTRLFSQLCWYTSQPLSRPSEIYSVLWCLVLSINIISFFSLCFRVQALLTHLILPTLGSAHHLQKPCQPVYLSHPQIPRTTYSPASQSSRLPLLKLNSGHHPPGFRSSHLTWRIQSNKK